MRSHPFQQMPPETLRKTIAHLMEYCGDAMVLSFCVEEYQERNDCEILMDITHLHTLERERQILCNTDANIADTHGTTSENPKIVQDATEGR